MPFPDALNRDPRPKIIFFTDFDGTITLQDTNDYITAHHGFGHAKLEEYTRKIASGELTFRDGFLAEVSTWPLSIPDVLEVLKRDIKLDPYFKEFAIWARKNNVPIVVVSSGMHPIIYEMLRHLVGEELSKDIEIVANDAVPAAPDHNLNKAGGWRIEFRDETDFGHDKSRAIRPYANAIKNFGEGEARPTLLYAGDGVSDLSAARETDLLFAKKGKDLVNYCIREGVSYTTFESWESILAETKAIYDGTKSVQKLASEAEKPAGSK